MDKIFELLTLREVLTIREALEHYAREWEKMGWENTAEEMRTLKEKLPKYII